MAYVILQFRRTQSLMAGKAWQPDHKEADHRTSASWKLKEMNASAQLTVSFLCGL